jgi:hypothetical protein
MHNAFVAFKAALLSLYFLLNTVHFLMSPQTWKLQGSKGFARENQTPPSKSTVSRGRQWIFFAAKRPLWADNKKQQAAVDADGPFISAV